MEEDTKLRDYVLNELANRQTNVFITGGAGTGKTHLLRQFINVLHRLVGSEENPHAVGVTASTGIAAIGISGRTIHSWSGVGYEKKVDPEKLLLRAQLVERWRKCHVLVIDEISMVGERLLSRISEIGSIIRGNTDPFGGLRVIFCGDFLQLPPVRDQCCLESDLWKKMDVEVVSLKFKHRQADPHFGDILDRVRMGRVTNDDVAYLTANSSQTDIPEAIRLCALFRRVSDYNFTRYAELQSKTPDDIEVTYVSNRRRLRDADVMIDTPGVPGYDDFKREDREDRETCTFPDVLRLRVGTRVQLLVNLDLECGLVNGSVGVVGGFIECAEVAEICAAKLAPLIKFDNGAVRLILPATCEEVGTDKDTTVTNGYRRQIPLQHAWALTIHKAQGLTLTSVEIDTFKIFASGQLYVALSRATTLGGIRFVGGSLEKKSAFTHGPTGWYEIRE